MKYSKIMQCTARKNLVALSIKQKADLCRKADQQPEWKRQTLCEWAGRAFGLGAPMKRPTVIGILKRKRDWLGAEAEEPENKRLRSSRIKGFDARLLVVVQEYKDWHPNATITGRTLKTLAADMETAITLKWSNGWMYGFQKRTGMWFALRHGEAASVDPVAVEEGRARLQQLINQYALRNVYNMDETSFFYKQVPRGTLTTDKSARGKKQDKSRLTMTVTTNADGSDHYPLLFIGKSKQPICMRGHDVREELGVEYASSRKAWMNTALFQDWLVRFDERMQCEGRHALLLVDNVSSHNAEGVELSHVRLEKLPPNTTAILQPLDQGIIKNVKDKYQEARASAEMQRFKARQPYLPVDVLAAMRWCAEGWQAVAPKSILNCWLHTGLVSKHRLDVLMDQVP